MSNNPQISLVRGLGLVAAISIIISNVIGTGVFLKARVMTCNVGSPNYVILVWIAAGILSLAGALTYAELAAMMPQAGGTYNFLRKAYGNMASFLFGWMQIFIAKAGSQAAVAVAFAIFLNDLAGKKLGLTLLKAQIPFFEIQMEWPIQFPFFTFSPTILDYELTTLQMIAVGLIVAVTVLNCASVSFSGSIATILTFVKIALILLVGLGAFLLADGAFGNFAGSVGSGTCEGVAANVSYNSADYTLLAGFAAAMLGALWGYDGWDNLTYVAGEVKNPSRNIPIALVGGTALIIVLYVFVNAAYFYVLPPEAVASVSKESSVAREVAARFFGASAITLMAFGLMASSFGTLHTSVLTGARIPYAMAQDGMFFKSLSKISPKTRVPVRALLAQGVWACILALSGSFDTLTDYVIFGSWIFYALATSSIFVFRIKYPEMERPYKAFGYPVVPVLFLLVATWLLVTTLVNSPLQSLRGIILILIGLPFYFYFMRQNADTNGKLKMDN
ncbi:MAG: amino acid permease [Pyrinomonadaceae bacterium]